MGLLQKIFGNWSNKRAITWDQLNSLGLLQHPTKSGQIVNEKTALGLSALYCGLKVISQDVGSLEPVLYREIGDQRDRAVGHIIHDLLCDSPNPEMTRPVFFETMMLYALLGNSVAEIERNNLGEPIALWPIHPELITFKRDDNNQLLYCIQGSDTPLTTYDVIHIPGFSPDGSVGFKLLQVARESFGFGLATMKYGSSFFSNCARPSGILSTTEGLDEVAVQNLTRSMHQLYGSAENVGKFMVLEEGLTYTQTQLTNEQSQYKDILNWFVYEVARFLNCPPNKLMSLEKASWGNLETLNQDYLTTTLRPWLVKFEKELERKLLSESDKKTHYVEFDTTTLLRADIATRYNAYAVALNNKFMTVDEVRARENLPPLPPDTTTEVSPQEPNA